MASDDVRPMTSVKGAGYRSALRNADPLRQAPTGSTPALHKTSEEGKDTVAASLTVYCGLR